MDDLNSEEQIQAAIEVFKMQTYQDWRIIVFTKNKDKVGDRKGNILILLTSENQVRNIEIAVTQHCKPQTYAFLLKEGDQLMHPNSLSTVADELEDREVLGGSFDLVIDGVVHPVSPDYMHFSRERDSVIDHNTVKIRGILNHMRVFSVDAFRYIPQLEWRDTFGVYL